MIEKRMLGYGPCTVVAGVAGEIGGEMTCNYWRSLLLST